MNIRSTLITRFMVLLISILLFSHSSYAEKILPVINLSTTTPTSLSVTRIVRNMSDNNEAINFWVFCQGSRGGGMGGGMCQGNQTLPSPTLTLTPNAVVTLNLNMHMAPQEQNAQITDANPYQGHTIHLHGLDMESQFDGVPETYQEDFGGSSVELRNGFSYKINSDPNNIRVDDRYIGSHMYHCHVHTVKHLEMGMYGAFIVKGSGAKANWVNNKGVSFDEEWTMMLSTVDPAYHADTATGDNPVFADYNPKYFLINGEEGNAATINPLLSKTIALTPGQTKKLLIRLMGMHSSNATFSIISNGVKLAFQLYNIDGFALQTPQDVTSVELSAGQTKDIVITIDRAAIYQPQIMFGDLRFNRPYEIIYSAGNVTRTSIVKTKLTVIQN